MSNGTMKHGVFMAPYHGLKENPTLLFQRDFELIELLDRLGYDEAWIGEHHSSGYETIASPELFIAAAAERTRRIRLGTGVVSLPYHNPLTVANRIIQLDHMTRGRIMFGVGPGLLNSDASMLGISQLETRDRMADALDVILRLMRGERVTRKTDWYTLVDAYAHILPYTRPHPEVAVASANTPSGGRMAGKHNLAMLCIATDNRDGFNALDSNWKVANEVAAEHGNVMDPGRLRLVMMVHVAETRDRARQNVRAGLEEFIKYFNSMRHGHYPVPAGVDPVDWFIDNKRAVIGTPDDVVAAIERLRAKQGEFGYFLQREHDWADWEATNKSYELYMRHVVPQLARANVNREASFRWIVDHEAESERIRAAAEKKMFDKHAEERGRRAAAS